MSTREAYTWVVPVAEGGIRLDRFLTAQKELGTRSQIRRLITDQLVWVEDRPAKAGTLVRPGQTIRVERPLPSDGTLRPQPMDLTVLFEDAWLLVIDKPAGLVVHPAPGHWEGTLVNGLLHRWRGSTTDLDPARLGIVHRLDKETSGVLVVAKDAATLAALGRQFRRREVKKEYLALVHGRLRTDTGSIDRPIARHPVHRKRMAVREHGRTAVTRYQVLERFERATFLRAMPETGRTHQIRVHLAALGHPILHDAAYGSSRPIILASLRRHALHASSIAFLHPSTGEHVAVKAELPADLEASLAELRQSKSGGASA
jgi:23S rRNA pseudouridine1911/1915/1917 synthase